MQIPCRQVLCERPPMQTGCFSIQNKNVQAIIPSAHHSKWREKKSMERRTRYKSGTPQRSF